MKIDKIKINGFGKIKNKEIELKDGMNLIYGENEAGKSTILKCIEAILYGVSKCKNGKDIADFDQYKPWNDSEFSGKIKYTLDNGQEYEVFREFKKKNPVIYQNNEDISNRFKMDKSKGIHFLEEQIGIDEISFCNTAMMSQKEVRLEKNDANHIVQKISNLVSSGDDNISFKKSIEKLNQLQNEQVGTDRTRQKPMNIVDENIKKLVSEKNNIKIYQENLISYTIEKEHLIQELEELQEEKDKLKVQRTTWNEHEIKNVETKLKMKIGIFIALFLGIIATVFVALKRYVIAIIPILLGIIDVFIILKIHQEQERNSNFDGYKIDKELEKIDAKMNDLKLKNHILENEKKNMDENLERLARIEEKLEEQKQIKEELLSLEISYNIAKECLNKAYDEVKHNLSPKFEQKLCEIASSITDGKYKNISVSDEYGLSIEMENGAYMPVDRLSVGTIDEMYLSLRLGILSEISKENLPILFDETFAYFDKNRLRNMICYLQDKNYDNQIIIFTCSNREEEILKELKIEYHFINL